MATITGLARQDISIFEYSAGMRESQVMSTFSHARVPTSPELSCRCAFTPLRALFVPLTLHKPDALASFSNNAPYRFPLRLIPLRGRYTGALASLRSVVCLTFASPSASLPSSSKLKPHGFSTTPPLSLPCRPPGERFRLCGA